jgi:hypothetical protein
VSTREADLAMLRALCDQHPGELSEAEWDAFEDMRSYLTENRFRVLSEKQHEWVAAVHQRIVPQYDNLVSSGLAPRGKEVASMVGALPKRPPPLPKTVAVQRPSAEHRPFRATGLDEEDDE